MLVESAAMRTRLLAVLASLALAASFLLVPTNAQAAVPAPPKVGQCWNYTWAQGFAASSPTPAVSCSRLHRAVTYYVGTITGAAARAADPATDPGVSALISRGCRIQQAKVLGPGVMLTLAWRGISLFVPSPAEWAAGARFYRCDIMLRTTDTSIGYIPSNFIALLHTKAGIEKFRWCATKTFASTPCSAKNHYYRSVVTVSLGLTTTPFPGTAKAFSRAKSLCATAVRKALGTTKKINAQWVPDATGWSQGTRSAACFVH